MDQPEDPLKTSVEEIIAALRAQHIPIKPAHIIEDEVTAILKKLLENNKSSDAT